MRLTGPSAFGMGGQGGKSYAMIGNGGERELRFELGWRKLKISGMKMYAPSIWVGKEPGGSVCECEYTHE